MGIFRTELVRDKNCINILCMIHFRQFRFEHSQLDLYSYIYEKDVRGSSDYRRDFPLNRYLHPLLEKTVSEQYQYQFDSILLDYLSFQRLHKAATTQVINAFGRQGDSTKRACAVRLPPYFPTTSRLPQERERVRTDTLMPARIWLVNAETSPPKVV